MIDPVTIIGGIVGMIVGIASTSAIAAKLHMDAIRRLTTIETQVELAISHESRLRTVEAQTLVLAQRADNHVQALQRIEARIDALIVELRAIHGRGE